MISHIRGGILLVTERYIVIEAGGIGYKVFATADTLTTLTTAREASLFTYLAVREDALDLYGFPNEDELGFFELLISVPSIGPKSALGILGVAAVDTLRRAIATGDTGYLTKVSGIGKKTAEKIVLELRDKLVAHANSDGKHSLRAESDTVLALQALGYTQAEARDALKQVSAEIADTNTRIKEALKILGQK